MIYSIRLNMSDATETHFINVDLEVRSTVDLTELVQAFEPGAWALNCTAFEDGYMANLELAIDPDEPEAAIRSFVALIRGLPDGARKLWDGASRRDFSIGVEGGLTPFCFELALTADVLKLAAEVGARIVFAVYANAETVSASFA